jgi:hypothetical protein
MLRGAALLACSSALVFPALPRSSKIRPIRSESELLTSFGVIGSLLVELSLYSLEQRPIQYGCLATSPI